VFLRILLQWLIIGLLLRGAWGLLRLFMGASRDGGRRRVERRPKAPTAKPPWDSKDVMDVGYEEVTPERKTS
jgi:hypothetical protein